ncbi:hypothetical protein BD413DRAFT_266467 [Trametes elegans]|nr:hypothetical protein BD413DRAFT_266467 [Trametes elegans]
MKTRFGLPPRPPVEDAEEMDDRAQDGSVVGHQPQAETEQQKLDTPPESPQATRSRPVGTSDGQLNGTTPVEDRTTSAVGGASGPSSSRTAPPGQTAGGTSANVSDGLISAQARVPAEVQAALSAVFRANVRTAGKVFAALATQMLNVATLEPALAANARVDELRRRMDEQCVRHEESLKAFGGRVEAEVAAYIQLGLPHDVQEVTARIIAGYIAEKVRQQLEDAVPRRLKDELADYRARVERARILCAESNARARNAQVREEFAGEPLLPLARPRSHAAGAGTPSPEFPRSVSDAANMSGERARGLVREYGLRVQCGEEDADGEDGVESELEWSLLGSDASEGEDGETAVEEHASTRGRGRGSRSRQAPRGAHGSGRGGRRRGGRGKGGNAPGVDVRTALLMARAEEVERVANLNALMRYIRMSMGTAMFAMWYAVCASMGDGADAGVRMDPS